MELCGYFPGPYSSPSLEQCDGPLRHQTAPTQIAPEPIRSGAVPVLDVESGDHRNQTRRRGLERYRRQCVDDRKAAVPLSGCAWHRVRETEALARIRHLHTELAVANLTRELNDFPACHDVACISQQFGCYQDHRVVISNRCLDELLEPKHQLSPKRG